MEDGEGSWALGTPVPPCALALVLGPPGGGVRDARHVWVVPSCLRHEDLGVGRDVLLSPHLRPFE